MKKLLLLLSLSSIPTQGLAFSCGGNFLNIFICKHTSTSVQEIIGTSLEVFGFILLLLGLLCFLYIAYLNLLGLFGKEEKNPFRITNFLFTKGQKNSPRISNFLRFFVFLALGLFCGYFLYWRFS